MPTSTVLTMRSRKRPRQGEGEEQHPRPSLPLDLLLEIAARTDPATLVRCAASCKLLRRHIADPALRPRLRLRHAGRFVPSLLRGHLVETPDGDVLYMAAAPAMDTAAAAGATASAIAATRLLSPSSLAACFPPAAPDGGKASRLREALAASDGLVLVRAADGGGLRVCDPETGRSQTLPPRSKGDYFLLVGGGGGGATVGRHFQVLRVNLYVFHEEFFALTDTYSSEQGDWGPRKDATAALLPAGWYKSPCKPLLVGGEVHWLLCLAGSSPSYILKLHVDTTRMTCVKLPRSFSHAWSSIHVGLGSSNSKQGALLATTSTGKGLSVIVASTEKVSVWSQAEHSPERWNHVVIESKELMGMTPRRPEAVTLEWFAERSGVVLMRTPYGDFFWLDLHAMKIVRWCSGSWMMTALGLMAMDCRPYEMDLSSWVPNLNVY